MDRRQFISTAFQIVMVSGGAFILKACGGSGGGGYGGNSSPPPAKPINPGNCLNNGTTVAIEAVHAPNHTLSVPLVDVVAGIQKTYLLTDNGSGHTHMVTLTAADFANLQNNQGIVEVSSLNSGHTHSVTVSCA